jgi:hypothetical protein
MARNPQKATPPPPRSDKGVVVSLDGASAVSVQSANGFCTIVDTGVINKTIAVPSGAKIEVSIRVAG